MANVKFQAPNPYSQQAADLNRRQKMAEMLQQQSMEPLQQQTAGGMVIPINPLAGLAKVLQSYTSSRQLSDLDKKRAGLEAQDIQRAQEIVAQFRPTQTVTPPTDAPMSATNAFGSSEGGTLNKSFFDNITKNATPNNAPSINENNPYQSPVTSSPQGTSLEDRKLQLIIDSMGAGPYASKMAEVMQNYKPETIAPLFAVGKQGEYTADSVRMAQEAQQRGDTNARRFLVAKQPEPKALPESPLSRMMRERNDLFVKNPNNPDIKQFDAAINQLTTSGQGSSNFSKGEIVALSDGKIVMSVFDPKTGKYYYETATGRKEVPPDSRPTTAGVAAPLSQRQFIEYRKLVNEDKNSIKRLDDYFKNVKDMNVGYTKYADIISANAKNFFAKELSPEEFAVQITKGQVQGLVGLFRTQIVGPGVVTEQDAQRIMSALGGDPSKLQNPVIVEQLLRDLYESKKANIEFLERELSRSNPYYGAPPATPIPTFGGDVPDGFVIENP